MPQVTEKQKKKLKRLAKVADKGAIGICEELNVLEDKIDANHEDVCMKIEEVKKMEVPAGHTPTKEELTEIIQPLIPKVKNGEDYILTEADKKEIASKITPTVVEKIVEKTEVIKEVPIVTENVVEVAKHKTPEQLRDDFESLKGDERLKIEAIKDLTEKLDELWKEIRKPKSLGGSVISGGVTRKIVEDLISQAGGGYTVETPTGDVDSSNTTFTVTAEPVYIISDGITYFDGAGYTYAALTITLDSPPTQYIRSFTQ